MKIAGLVFILLFACFKTFAAKDSLIISAQAGDEPVAQKNSIVRKGAQQAAPDTVYKYIYLNSPMTQIDRRIHTGKELTIIGGSFIGSGVVLIGLGSVGFIVSVNSSAANSVPLAIISFMSLLIGPPVIIAGIPILIVGAVRLGKATREKNNLMSLQGTINSKGQPSLTFRF